MLTVLTEHAQPADLERQLHAVLDTDLATLVVQFTQEPHLHILGYKKHAVYWDRILTVQGLEMDNPDRREHHPPIFFLSLRLLQVRSNRSQIRMTFCSRTRQLFYTTVSGCNSILEVTGKPCAPMSPGRICNE